MAASCWSCWLPKELKVGITQKEQKELKVKQVHVLLSLLFESETCHMQEQDDPHNRTNRVTVAFVLRGAALALRAWGSLSCRLICYSVRSTHYSNTVLDYQ